MLRTKVSSPILGEDISNGEISPKPKFILPINHREIHEDTQKRIFKQKTLGLRRMHYQNYPNFHKDEAHKEVDRRSGQLRDPTPLKTTDDFTVTIMHSMTHSYPQDKKVLALRQAFDNLEHGHMDVRMANNGMDHSEIDSKYTTVVRTPFSTPGPCIFEQCL